MPVHDVVEFEAFLRFQAGLARREVEKHTPRNK